MDFRGQRFTIDLSDDDDNGDGETGATSSLPSNATPSFASAFIGDIKERPTQAATAPKLKSSSTGFPEHKKRVRVSAFKKQRGGSAVSAPADPQNAPGLSSAQSQQPTNTNSFTQEKPTFEEVERRRIDEENNQRLAAMSAEEIAEERAELLATLDPSLVEMLLRRANLDKDRGGAGIDPPKSRLLATEGDKLEQLLKKANLDDGRGDTGIDPPVSKDLPPDVERSVDTVSGEHDATQAPKPIGKAVAAQKSIRFEDEEPIEPIDIRPVTEPITPIIDLLQPSIHFPNAEAAPELDPNDPSFLENLHRKYFPSLPADPTKLAWMAPIPTHGSVADQASPYYPAHEALPASAIRFDFKGDLLPPRIARAMPTTKGLHHHGEAPEAAGYTIPELARLARSAFPAQRCVAFQTLGRVLIKLGKGRMGDEGTEIAKGLWRCIDEGKVIPTLEEAANAEGGHQGSKAYAVEALWLWHKGGGKVWKAD